MPATNRPNPQRPMPNDGDPGEAARTALPPLELTLVVPAPPERAFDYFARDWGLWWPKSTHSVCLENASEVVLEQRVGGRLIEKGSDGSVHVWGHVEIWSPPERLKFSWHPGGTPDQALWVDVSFSPNPKGTLVKLVQGGWEVLGDMAVPVRSGYEQGWGSVFKQIYAAYCDVKEGAR